MVKQSNAILVILIIAGACAWMFLATRDERSGEGHPTPAGTSSEQHGHGTEEPIDHLSSQPHAAQAARRDIEIGTGTAVLSVHCVDASLGEPIPAVTIAVTVEGDDEPLVERILDRGQGSLRVPAVTALTIVAREIGGDQRAGTQHIEPLVDGSTLPILVALDAPCFFGRAIDVSTDGAIAGAIVRPAPALLEDDVTYRPGIAPISRPGLTTDEEGVFRIAREGAAGGLVTALGFAPCWFAVIPGHATAEDALPLRLSPGSQLEVTVVDSEGIGVAGVVVRLGLVNSSWVGGLTNGSPGSPNVEWTATTGKTGQVSLHDLPAGVYLTLTLALEGRTQLEDPVVLTVGELSRRRIVFLPTGLKISGIAVDEGGNRVPHLEVAATKARWTYPRLLKPGSTVLARTTTDDQGNFRLEDLSEARILIGPSPEQGIFAPVAFPARPVPMDSSEQPLVLSVQRAESISGVLIDENAQSLTGHVYAEGIDGLGEVGAQTDHDGVFVLQGLTHGKYTVYADVRVDGQRIQSRRVVVEAGTDDLFLTVGRQPGGLAIDAVDKETGSPKTGMMSVGPVGGAPYTFQMPGPRFWLRNCQGDHWVVVTTADNYIGVARVTVQPGRETRFELPMRPAVLLTISRESEGLPAFVRYWSQENVCLQWLLFPGEKRTFAVPEGSGHLELTRCGEVLFREPVDLKSGPVEIVID